MLVIYASGIGNLYMTNPNKVTNFTLFSYLVVTSLSEYRVIKHLPTFRDWVGAHSYSPLGCGAEITFGAPPQLSRSDTVRPQRET